LIKAFGEITSSPSLFAFIESLSLREESCTPVLLPDFLDISNVDDESVGNWLFVLSLPQLQKECNVLKFTIYFYFKAMKTFIEENKTRHKIFPIILKRCYEKRI